MSRVGILAVLTISACGVQEAPLIRANTISGDAITQPLTETAGDTIRGEQLFVSRNEGHCILCHQVDGLDAEFQGDVGPDLTLVGDRLSAGQLRLRIADYQLVQPGALMPSYYRIHDLHQVGEAYSGESVLSAQKVEDIVAYLVERRASGDDA
ncbi:MAG: sulfur oxidation c-type cytochrome SoxX [Alphaproteobacteria bacterium]|nr:sulfur oxidation c-type cytochrome SoxX [Alphaproteobacteria bacterium]